jgi:exopolysaccharide biosynthesis predicted pyruvyltransferase EpsI
MKKVAILNWAGHGNFGDELIIEGLKQLFKNCEVTVFTDSPNKEYPQVNFKQINKHDLFVLGGGELINEDRLFIPPSWSKKIKIPKIILGCGVNVNTPNQLSSKVVDELKNFSYIGLRDRTAVDILNLIPELRQKTDLFYDLTFSLDMKKYNIIKNKSKNTAVVIPTDRVTNQADKGIAQYNLAQTSKDWLKIQLSNFENTMFLPFGVEDNDDHKTCESLSVYAKNPTIIPHKFITPDYVFTLITNAQHVFPYRLHGMILAYILGTPYTYYPYHNKLSRVHNTIIEKTPRSIKQTQKDKIEVVKKFV